MSSHSSTANLVGVHYRVGKKIGEGSFGVIFEGPFYVCSSMSIAQFALVAFKGTNLLNSQTVAIKFVRTADRMDTKDDSAG
jgi:casein kinase 1